MLDIIKKLDSGTIRGLIVATIPLLVLIGSLFGVDEAVFKASLEGWGEKLVALVSLAGVAWAAYARVFKPTPPLTEQAAQATQAMLQKQASPPAGKQGGFVRAGMLALILALSVALPAIVGLQGCSVLGAPQLQGWNERLAGGYSSVTAVRQTASVLLEGKVRAARAIADPGAQEKAIAAAKADAQNLQDQADKAREGLDVARTLRDVNFGDADARLASTLRVLEALQAYLAKETP